MLRSKLVEHEAWEYEHRHDDLTQAWVALIRCLTLHSTQVQDKLRAAEDISRSFELTALIKVFGAGKTTLGKSLCKALGVPAVREGLRVWANGPKLSPDPAEAAALRNILDRILALVPGTATPTADLENQSFSGMQYLYIDHSNSDLVKGKASIRAQVSSAVQNRHGLLVHLDEVGKLTPKQVASLRNICQRAVYDALNEDTMVFFLWTGKFLEMPVDSSALSLSTLFRFIDVKPLTQERVSWLTQELLRLNPPLDDSGTPVSPTLWTLQFCYVEIVL